jgi:hypothetical protein
MIGHVPTAVYVEHYDARSLQHVVPGKNVVAPAAPPARVCVRVFEE